jgi:TetR/AcrR family transcriptional regulator, transcriptional repressor for nem operon
MLTSLPFVQDLSRLPMARKKAFDESAVLDRALDLFWTNGYHATSIEDLIAHLGISRSSLYGTYGEKHPLFITCLKRYIERNKAYFLALLADPACVADLLTRVLDDKWRQQRAYKDRRGCFLVNTTTELTTSDKEAAKLITGCNTRVLAILTGLMERGVADGSLRKDLSPPGASLYVHTVLCGFHVGVRAGMNEEGFEQLKRNSLAALVRS